MKTLSCFLPVVSFSVEVLIARFADQMYSLLVENFNKRLLTTVTVSKTRIFHH